MTPPMPCRSASRDLSPRDEDLPVGSAREALLVDDIELQVLFQLGEWAAPRADSDGNRHQLVFVDQAKAGQRLREIGAAVDQSRSFVVPSLQLGDPRAQ